MVGYGMVWYGTRRHHRIWGSCGFTMAMVITKPSGWGWRLARPHAHNGSPVPGPRRARRHRAGASEREPELTVQSAGTERNRGDAVETRGLLRRSTGSCLVWCYLPCHALMRIRPDRPRQRRLAHAASEGDDRDRRDTSLRVQTPNQTSAVKNVLGVACRNLYGAGLSSPIMWP